MQLFRSVILTATALAATLLSVPASAQGLGALIEKHQKRVRAIEAADPYKPEDLDKELNAQVGRLRAFLAEAKVPDDLFRGRLLLTNALRTTGKRKEAIAALAGFDPKKLSTKQLLEAATWARRLRMKDKQQEWVDAALARKMALIERMEVARLLMTELQDVDRGIAIFKDALAAQKDDEGRAMVLWYQAKATRDREDLPEGAYDKALQALSKKHPKTRYGSIASDRLRAFDLKAGHDPIAFEVKTTDGKTRKNTDYKGRVLLLYFWASDSSSSETLATRLRSLRAKYADKGLDLLGICLDPELSSMDKAVRALKIDWPQAFVGGPEADIALRYKAELPPHLVLLGKNGKVAGVNFDISDSFGMRELEQTVSKAVAVTYK